MWHDPVQVLALIDEHLARRPKMAPSDVYKLIYQGVMGPEHLIASPDSFLAYLRLEWDALLSGPEDTLLENIRPDGRLSRLNLRPYRASGGDFEQLAETCLQTAQHTWGNMAELRSAWAIFSQACSQRYKQYFAQSAIVALTVQLEAENFPPIHHSETYRQIYHPAYRLCTSEDF